MTVDQSWLYHEVLNYAPRENNRIFFCFDSMLISL